MWVMFAETRNLLAKNLPFTSVCRNSGQPHVRVPSRDIAFKNAYNLTGLSLGPAEMKHRTRVLQIYSEVSFLRMPVEIDDALSHLYMFDTHRLPGYRDLGGEVQDIVLTVGLQPQHAVDRCGKKC